MNYVIHDVIDGVEELQSLPTIALDVMAMLNDPSTSVKEVAKKIILDQTMVPFIIKQCNSPLYGIKEEVTTLTRAINLLGFSRIRSVMMSYFMRNMYRITGNDKFKTDLWSHSIGVALFSRHIGLFMNKNPEETYVMGLLHDLGKIVLFLHKPQIYKEIINKAEEAAHNFVDIEKGIFGFDHSECGALLLKEWKLSPKIIQPILYHHDRTNYYYKGDENIAIVALADHLYYQVIQDQKQPQMDNIFDRFKFNPNEINEICKEVLEIYPSYVTAMGLN